MIDLVVSKFRVTKAINRQFFALQISRTIGDNKTAHWIPNNYTLPDINQRLAPFNFIFSTGGISYISPLESEIIVFEYNSNPFL